MGQIDTKLYEILKDISLFRELQIQVRNVCYAWGWVRDDAILSIVKISVIVRSSLDLIWRRQVNKYGTAQLTLFYARMWIIIGVTSGSVAWLWMEEFCFKTGERCNIHPYNDCIGNIENRTIRLEKRNRFSDCWIIYFSDFGVGISQASILNIWKQVCILK